jgi:hypothetical protein
LVKRGGLFHGPLLIKFGCINIAQTIGLKKKYLSLIAATIWFILSLILLTLPGSAIPKENWLDKIWADKWVHLILFGLLTIFWCRVLFLFNNKKEGLVANFIVIAVLFTVYGIGMELVQKYCISNRSFDIGDILADTTGSLLGYLYAAGRYTKK